MNKCQKNSEEKVKTMNSSEEKAEDIDIEKVNEKFIDEIYYKRQSLR